MAGFVTAPRRVARARRTRRGLWRALDYALMLALAAFFLFPIVFMVVSSLKNDEAQLLRDMTSLRAFVPSGDVGAQNYRDVFDKVGFWRAALNSGVIVALTVGLGLIVNSMFAYALARLRFPGRGVLLGAVVALIIVPFQAIAVPLLLLVNQLPWIDGSRGWLDSLHVQIIPFIANAFSVYLFYQFFIGLPVELEEAARVDGASRARVYWSILLPLSGPVIATVAVLQFLARWGELLWPVMAVRLEAARPLPLAMQTFFGQQPRQWGDIMAFATLTTLPTLLLFFLFQRWFVQSVASTGVKG